MNELTGAQLRRYRKDLGLTQEEVGDHLDLTRNSVSQMELNKDRLVPQHHMAALKKLFLS